MLPVMGAKTIQEKGPCALEGKTLPEHSSSLAPMLLPLLYIFQVFCIWKVWGAQFVSQDCVIEIQCLGAWEETFWKIMLRDVNYCLNRYSRVWGFMTRFTFFFKIIVFPMCCQGRWGTAAFSCFWNMGTGDKVIAQQWTDPSYPARHSSSLSCWLQWDSQLMHMAFWLSRKVSVQDNFIEKQAGDCLVF